LDDFAAEAFTHPLQLLLISSGCICRDVLEDGLAAQVSADFRLDDQRVGLAFPNAEFLDVVTHIRLVVIGVIGIAQLLAAGRSKIVDPSQSVPLDEVGVKAKSGDDQIIG
jgi:hypothetical protein